ncbi:MAG: hypothetical protein QOE23_1695 [Pseudonocardiales bacterium]|jgi:hypothetical protein|nr:hypothetical protein [Pseudonocardiales bacterium]
MPGPQLQLTLIGPWCPFDPADPLRGSEYGELRQELTGLGWLPAPHPSDASLALAVTMIEPGEDPDVVPLFASLFVHEHRGRVKAALTPAGAIVPGRRKRTFSVDWPTADIGIVEFSQLTYEIPLPGSDCFYTMAFTTPNLTRLPELEFVFDAIVSTATWIDEEVKIDEEANQASPE